ncbi:hypothetical protein [Allomuricauda sp. d1]|uniref:hypothetical protein n=1 Tax=Allomuricauda sp. d1 TaxID=3136725 RepID=UPI0031D60774
MKYSFLLLAILIFSSQHLLCQKREREFRLRPNDFPKVALVKIAPYLKEARRKRFYKEFDGEKTSYEAKFKKDRLFYSVEFDSLGVLEDVEFNIDEDDIPEESFEKIESYLQKNYERERIKKIQQQHPRNEKEEQTTLREAFQNLLLPDIRYELIIAHRGKKGFEEYELLFDAEGNFLSARQSFPQKYDHVLY